MLREIPERIISAKTTTHLLIVFILVVVSSTGFLKFNKGAKDWMENSSILSDWEVEKYHAAEIEHGSGNIIIKMESPPAGLFLRKTLDPHKRYELKVEGSGKANMRISTGEGKLQYYSAPSVKTSLRTISDTKNLEVLFYSDSVSLYEIFEASISQCPQCKTDDDYYQEMISEPGYPLQDNYNSTAEFALALLNWASNHADYAKDGKIIDISKKLNSKGAAQRYIEGYKKDMVGSYCGGLATFFTDLMKLEGFTAFTINFGTTEHDLTHVTSVIYNLFGSEKFYILDPTFNGYFARPSGELIDVETLLSTNHIDLQFVENAVASRDYLFSKSPQNIDNNFVNCSAIKAEQTTIYSCKQPNYSSKVYFKVFGPHFQKIGLSPNAIGVVALLRHRIFSVGTAPDEVHKAFLTILNEKAIPYGYPNQAITQSGQSPSQASSLDNHSPKP